MNKPLHQINLTIFADYNQFYIWDPEISERMAPIDWSEENIADRALAELGVVVICPVRNMEVPVTVSIWDAEPILASDDWQHVVDAPLKTKGTIEIHESTGEAKADFKVSAGDYTVRALFRNLDKLSENGLEGEDHYEIHIWKAVCQNLKVIKRWP